MEDWIDIPKYPKYQVSTRGQVKNKKTGHILKPSEDRYGYLKLSLGNVNNVPVHRLVCESFYGAPTESNQQVNHIDCNRKNNHVLNLSWCTPSENIKWSVQKGNINPNKGLDKAKEVNHRPVKIIELNKTFSSVKDCAEYLNVEPTNVSRCIRGARKGQRLHGYHLEYANEEV